MTAPACPDTDRLLRYAAGRVADDERAGLAAHLEGCSRCRATLQGALDQLREAPTRDAHSLPVRAPRAAEVPAQPPPQKVGRYLVLELLGAGGMGEVLLAYDPALDRRVAIKLARRIPGDDDQVLEARLRREAQSLARVVDPHVVAVHDVGTVDGRPFVAMEYVPGTTLKGVLRAKEKRPRADVLRLFLQAARGLAAAHRVGVVHRDFKPENVLIDAKGNARVTDFGLATLQDAPPEQRAASGANVAEEDTQLILTTQLNVALGTPGYMPPEQWAGEPADARSDQFSFCVSLHEGLVGARPFTKSGFQDNRPEFTVSPELLRLRKELPAGLRRVLERGLALEPAQRFPSMEPIIAELERALNPWRKGWVAAAAAVVLVAGGGAVALTRSPCHGALQRIQSARQRVPLSLPGAVAARVNEAAARFEAGWAAAWTSACVDTHERREQPPEVLALRNECLGRQARRYELVLGQLGATRADVRATALEALELGPRPDACLAVEALLSVDQPPPGQQETVRALQERLLEARVLIDVGRYVEARAALEALSDDVAAATFRPTTALHTFLRGYLEFREQRWREARPLLRDGFAQAVAARDLPLAARAGSETVYVSGYVLGFLDEAQLVGDLTRGLVQRLEDREPEARLENALGLVALGQYKLDEARLHFEKARALRVDLLGKDHLDTAKVAGNLGLLAQKQGRLEDAATLLGEDLRVREATLGSEHPLVAVTLVLLSGLASEQQRHEGAIALLQRALDIRLRVFGDTHPLVLATRADLALALTAAGHFDEARATERQVLEQARAAYGDESVEVADALDALAQTETAAGALEDALRDSRSALERYSKRLPPRDDAVMNEREREAELLVALGRFDEASSRLDGLVRDRRAEPENAGPLASILALRGQLLVRQRRGAVALPALEESLRLATPLDWHPERLGDLEFLLAQASGQAGRSADARRHADAAQSWFEKANKPTKQHELEVWRRALK